MTSKSDSIADGWTENEWIKSVVDEIAEFLDAMVTGLVAAGAVAILLGVPIAGWFAADVLLGPGTPFGVMLIAQISGLLIGIGFDFGMVA